ncbi:GNAT family N-acetyltransferase [Actinokineospora sp. G85]|uniref:GNAT family N-acetyltransferase n=1 Tax=Actinokineospora sp. G85 TaxID=3406626 RepID=UPI003C74E44A
MHDEDGYPVEGVDDPRAWLVSDALLIAFVATSGTSVVGHVGVSRPGPGDDAAALWANHPEHDGSPIAVLGRLFVDPRARGEQVGERLVRAAMNHAGEHDLRLVLDVMTKDRAAIRLYERLGWTRIGEAQHHFGAGESITALCFVAPIRHDGPGHTKSDAEEQEP